MQDGVARDARVTRLGTDFRWPGGRLVAVVFNVAYEAWSDGKAPGIGPMGNPLKAGVLDLQARSWAAYGPEAGAWRLLEILEGFGLKAVFYTSGTVAQRYRLKTSARLWMSLADKPETRAISGLAYSCRR